MHALRIDRPSVLTALIVLSGCASAARPSAQLASQAPPSVQGFQPIVFGDDPEHAYTEPFFLHEGRPADYDDSLPPPERLLGNPVGARLAHHAEILAAFRAWAELSPKLRLTTYARSFEGRELVYALISSPENLARIEAIQADVRRLQDPRGLSQAEGESLCERTPAFAWLGYSIHGDETSGADASLAVAYHLLAGRDPEVRELLREVVVVMDPVMNPDGRERFLGMVEQSAGYVTNLDYASMHRGRWPEGRGNHYLFDMNRDWMAGTAPETRGRWSVALAYPPQLFVDGHEMGALDTFLFYPQAEPRLPMLPERLGPWQGRFAQDAARAFDARGWSYYTREWADAWCPFYSDAWGSLNGAVGMLYEQSGIGGAPLRRDSGKVVSYRQMVHGQALASWSNLQTLARERAAVLRDYLAHRRRSCDAGRPGGERACVLVPGGNASREADFVQRLLAQGIEVWRAEAAFDGRAARNALGESREQAAFPAGSYLVPVAQPQGALVEAYLGFDTRLSDAQLLREREELEQRGQSKLYDVTAWDLGSAFGLDVWWCSPEPVEREAAGPHVRAILTQQGAIVGDAGAAATAWVVEGTDDRSVLFAARALEQGLAVHVAKKAFAVAEEPARELARGSVLVRASENGPDVRERVARAAERSGARVEALGSARAPGEGPDLGGHEFELLERPRIAIVGNAPIEREGYGHLWHCLDAELRLPATLLDAQGLSEVDLRRYNVLVLPPSRSLASLLGEGLPALRDWVRGGGTLIAVGGSAAALASAEIGLSEVRERGDVLEELPLYAAALEREARARAVAIDPASVWDGLGTTPAPAAETARPEAAGGADSAQAAEREAWLRRFAPSGVFLRARVDRTSWLTYGLPAELPVFSSGASVLLAREPVQVPLRLAGAKELRLGGLLWPEARERLADSAWLTREGVGAGQLILFASPPTHRGSLRATARVLANAIVYGPGLGASPARAW